MELNFTFDGDHYIAQQQVNADYNLKLEFEKPSVVFVSHCTAGTKFAHVQAYTNIEVVDDDFDGCVYPKTIRIKSTKLPTFAAITE